MTRRGPAHTLLTSARSFLSYSHHKLLTTLDSSVTSSSRRAAREPSHILLKAVLIQNAMDDVDGLVRTLQSEVKKEELKIQAPVPRRSSLGQESWFEVIREEDETDDEDESIHVPAVQDVPDVPAVVAAAAAAADTHAEGEWFEQHWRELQEDESDESSTDEWEAAVATTEVQVVAVSDDDDDDEDEDDQLDMFPPLPSVVVQVSPIGRSVRDEIYKSMPSSPLLQPTVIYDKMYVTPPTVGQTSPSPSSPSPSPSPSPSTTPSPVDPYVAVVTPVYDDLVDSTDDFSDSSSDSDTDSEGLITPQQDIIDDFGSVAEASAAAASSSCSDPTRKDTRGVTDNERKGGDVGGCENCPGCRGEMFVVNEDEVYF